MTRRRGPVEEAGRRVPASAYAWYNRALFHERNGDDVAAAQAFKRTLALDPQSGAAWASLGRVLCQRNSKPALEVFSDGLQNASRLAPIYIARGNCQYLSFSDREEALRDGFNALRHEPDNPEATALIVKCYRATGRRNEADRFERGYRLYAVDTLERAMLFPHPTVDHALRQGRLIEARTLALGDVTPGELAARAMAWGQDDIARIQALLVYGASPKDGNALVVLSLLGENTEFRGETLSPVSAVTILLLGLQLRRLVDEDAAYLFMSSYREELASSMDPLVRRLLKDLLPQKTRRTE